MVRRIGYRSLDGLMGIFVEVGQMIPGCHDALVTKIELHKGAVPGFTIHLDDGEKISNVGFPYSAVYGKEEKR